MSKYTPGPWHIVNLVEKYEKEFMLMTEKGAALIGNKDGVGIGAARANAKLACAAPELAEALQECLAALDYANTLGSNETLALVKANERIQAAQKKAKEALSKAGL